MNKLFVAATACIAATSLSVIADDGVFILQSDKNSLVVTAYDGQNANLQYFGPRIKDSDVNGLFDARATYWNNTIPGFGVGSYGETALSVQMPDGSIGIDLKLVGKEMTKDDKGELLILTFRDKDYPLTVNQFFRHYADTEIFSSWIDITNDAKKGDVTLLNFCSATVPLLRADNYLTQFHGGWGHETGMSEEKLPNGQSVLADKAGLRNAFGCNPGFMISIDGKPQENRGIVFGGNLIWSGNYKTKIETTNNDIKIYTGINEENSIYRLKPGETFVTPEFTMTMSDEGKGGVSRAYHKWGRKYGMTHGDKLHDILLNSWEGVYFGVNQETMDQMMADIAALGGELFVMDDGWFGDKYPRNNDRSSLGDWVVAKSKLPLGIKGLTDAAKKHGIKFGIWIEPEMANTTSELYEKHPDWVLQQPKRELMKGRGETQVVLDLTNPEVQDYVFSIVDNLMSQNPEIAYIKWDCNADIMNYGSLNLPKDRQCELYIRYHKSLMKVLDRIRAKYPDLAIQLCASGGGRADYGLLPWYDEFWTSDNTDAYQRIFIQWGASHFYPAIAQASHVSASPNHQTRRIVPIKFRFDVAMSGRLGMEIQPKNMSDEEKEFSKRAIAAYKEIRPVVQFGDQYRLISPYDKKAIAALMYADEAKDKAVLFAYRMDFLNNQHMPMVRLDGVDVNKNYRLKDLTPANPDKKSELDGKVISGRVLKNAGLNLNNTLGRPWSSVAIELVAE